MGEVGLATNTGFVVTSPKRINQFVADTWGAS